MSGCREPYSHVVSIGAATAGTGADIGLHERGYFILCGAEHAEARRASLRMQQGPETEVLELAELDLDAERTLQHRPLLGSSIY